MADHFVVDGFPRTGSTTLLRILNCHPDICCAMEPFHPDRNGGRFFKLALQTCSVKAPFRLIWVRSNGIKHVWEPVTGWPFVGATQLNDEIVLTVGKVIFMRRRNMLRRLVSQIISHRLNLWVGTKQMFYDRLKDVCMREISPRRVRQELLAQQRATEMRLRIMKRNNVNFRCLFYEDFLGENMTPDKQYEIINDLLRFLRFGPISKRIFEEECMRYVTPNKYRWASEEIYRLIPNSAELDREVGSQETGWLFR